MPDFPPLDTPAQNAVDPLLCLPDVRSAVGLSSATLYRMIDSGTFPRPIKIGRASRWPASEIAAFIEAQKAERDTPTSMETL